MKLHERIALLDPWRLTDDDVDLLREGFDSGDQQTTDLIFEIIEGTSDEPLLALLIEVAADRARSPELRGRAAIALGPALEMYKDEIDFPDGFGDSLDQALMDQIRTTLQRIVEDGTESTLMRRRALEASIRFEEEWHTPLVRRLWLDPDPEWRATAVFAMAYLDGFGREISGAVEDDSFDELVRAEAIRSAGRRGMTALRRGIRAIARNSTQPKRLRMAAMEAAVEFGPPAEATSLLGPIARDDADPEVRELAMALIAEQLDEQSH